MTEAFLPAEREQIAELVMGNHILALKEVVDGFGHISVRSASRPNRFLQARSMAPSLVAVEDIHLFDLDGECTTQPDIKSYLERYIHSEIYRARPDVQAVVHAHSMSVVPFSVVPNCSLRPIFHMASFIQDELPIFEIRSMDEGSDMLIRSPELGAAMVKDLGLATAVLMRGHGVTVVGQSVKQAVFRAYYLEMNARVQSIAQALGEPIFLNAAEARASTLTNDPVIERPWALWERDVAAAKLTARQK
jgi:ribulose-5-phosphate 4-epimerase/fuculose-1-phosphate aldolase